MLAAEDLKQLAGLWGIPFARACPELLPAGSPERTLCRVVIESADGKTFVFEQIAPSLSPVKLRIIEVLGLLAQRGMGKLPVYRADAGGQYLQEYAGKPWQCVPFYFGEELDRSTYLDEGWRAGVLARFLLELKRASSGLSLSAREEGFSLRKYISTLCTQVRARRPELVPQISEVMAFLERGFMAAYDALPVGFCHGDYHPLNVIWGKEDIRIVIDWEFMGMKPELYDAANMVGCLGMEHPSSLEKDIVVDFIRQLRGADAFQAMSWEYFLPLVVALRFAWLSEWLRKGDEDMVVMELEYMLLLIGNEELLRRKWM